LIQVLDRIISGVEEFGFSNKGWIESPIKGAEGNMEFLACFHRIPTAEPEPEAEATKAGATWLFISKANPGNAVILN
jgi:23S rRNA (cytidine1920-2'-O)/16S rRNA (cytidine1409-2'-O)-methyltransferase